MCLHRLTREKMTDKLWVVERTDNHGGWVNESKDGSLFLKPSALCWENRTIHVYRDKCDLSYIFSERLKRKEKCCYLYAITSKFYCNFLGKMIWLSI